MKTYSDKLKDPRWQKIRLKIFDRDEFTCQRCSETKKTLCIHHLEYAPSGLPWDSKEQDLITLCSECHELAEYYLKGIRKRVHISSFGRLLVQIDNISDVYGQINGGFLGYDIIHAELKNLRVLLNLQLQVEILSRKTIHESTGA